MSDDVRDEDDEELDEKTRERVDRVRGKRESRPSRRRGRSGTQSDQATNPEQAPQAAQEEQSKNAEQATKPNQEADAMTTDSQTEAGQAQESEQPPQAEQEKQSTMSNVSTVADLGPVTQREHDTYYLDENVREELERVYRRMSLDLLEETGVDLDEQRVGGRNRYFRPLALLLGAREIADMSPEELRETVEQEGLIDDLPDEE